jgi:flagellar biosynthesis protein FlhF
MKIKKVSASNTQLALTKIKQMLGDDAVILHVKEHKDNKTQKRFVEVTAALDEEYQHEKELWPINQMKKPARKIQNSVGVTLEESDVGFTYSTKNPLHNSIQHTRYDLQSSSRELAEVKKQLDSFAILLQESGYPELPPQFLESYIKLIHAGVNKQLAYHIVSEVEKRIPKESHKSNQYIQTEIGRSIENVLTDPETITLSTNSTGRVKILVGPTGVGKTTCIAKLAAIDKIYNNKTVGLLSMDTYRIAAIEQLQTYATITKLPFEVVYSPTDIEPAHKNLSNCDVIYVDTPGRSPNNGEALKEMSNYFREFENPEVHLVLSLNSKEEDMCKTVERFSMFPIQKILFTKLDETNTIGAILSILRKAKKPISYISTGQNVPDDIIKPEKKFIAKMLMGEHV